LEILQPVGLPTVAGGIRSPMRCAGAVRPLVVRRYDAARRTGRP